MNYTCFHLPIFQSSSSFLRGAILHIIYINIYISISYNIYKDCDTSFFNWKTGRLEDFYSLTLSSKAKIVNQSLSLFYSGESINCS